MIDARTFRLSIGLSLVVVAGLSLGVYPGVRSYSRLTGKVAAAEAAVERAADQPNRLVRETEALEQLRAFVDDATRPIPSAGDVAGLIRDLVTHLDALGVQDREISAGAAAPSADIRSLPMTLSLKGDFGQIAGALERIESIDRLLRLSRLSVERDSDGRLTAQVMIDVVFTGDVSAQTAAAEVRE